MLLVFFLLFLRLARFSLLFFFNDTATTEIYTLSLHDALPISRPPSPSTIRRAGGTAPVARIQNRAFRRYSDRKSTRLNSSHQIISYAVFCLKKKKKERTETTDNHYAPIQARIRRVSSQIIITN